jgi:hypothetical protein
VLTWLLPDQRTIGTPWYADPDPLWLTIVDDLDPAAAGPSSFDRQALCWWAKRAEVIVVDAAKPHPRKLGPPALLVAQGRLVLVVQTKEERREVWHQFFRDARAAGTPTLVIDIMNSSVPGAQPCRMRIGGLGTEFPADAPYTPPRRGEGTGSPNACPRQTLH